MVISEGKGRGGSDPPRGSGCSLDRLVGAVADVVHGRLPGASRGGTCPRRDQLVNSPLIPVFPDHAPFCTLNGAMGCRIAGNVGAVGSHKSRRTRPLAVS